jgi:hypothetical protein
MEYTIRFCHLKEPVSHKVGDKVVRGDFIGMMGNSGASKSAHLHIDCVRGRVQHMYHLKDMNFETLYPDIQQLNHFIDDELFDYKILITSYFFDPGYKRLFGKDHPAYDVVPENRKRTKKNYKIFWNRSKTGTVLFKGYDSGYGNFIYIGFNA